MKVSFHQIRTGWHSCNLYCQRIQARGLAGNPNGLGAGLKIKLQYENILEMWIMSVTNKEILSKLFNFHKCVLPHL